MFKVYVSLLLFGHILGDYYIQTSRMAKKKDEKLKWVFLHSFCYLGAMLLISIPLFSQKLILGAVFASVLHLCIDVLKYWYVFIMTRKKKNTLLMERNVFFIDQILHVVCLLWIAYWLATSERMLLAKPWVENFFQVVGIAKSKILYWCIVLLGLHKPANIVIQKLLLIYKPRKEEAMIVMNKNAGRLIGTVERILMLILISIGQYSAIGLVLTAKSIARYDKISKDQQFAEYYLLGTLLSTVIAIALSLLI